MNTEDKNCPFCGETIKAVAIKCKHCQSDLSTPEAKVTVETESKIEQLRKIREETGVDLKEAYEKLEGVQVPLQVKKYNYFSKLNLILFFLIIPLPIWTHYDRMERNNKNFFGNPKSVSSQSSVQTAKTPLPDIDSQTKFKPIQFKCVLNLYGSETITYYKLYQTKIDMEIWNQLDKNNAFVKESLNIDLSQKESNLHVYISDDKTMTLKYDIIKNLLWDYSGKNPFNIGSDSNSCKTSFL